MSLRGRFSVYLIFVHLVFGAVTAYLLRAQPVWLVVRELFFLLSFLIGLRLIRSLFEPIKILRSAVEFIRDHEFSTRMGEVGQEGRVTMANPSAAGMLQVEPDELKGRTLEDLGTPLAARSRGCGRTRPGCSPCKGADASAARR